MQKIKGITLLLFGLLSLYVMIFNRDFYSTIASYALYPAIYVYHHAVDPCVEKINYYYALVTVMEDKHKIEQKYHEVCQKLIDMQSQVWYLNQTELDRGLVERYHVDQMRIAQVMVRHLSHQEHYILINKGLCHGIKPDMVAVSGHYIVGRVSEVFPWYCKVILVTDRLCKIPAMCGKGVVYGVHAGLNDLISEVSYVDSDVHKIRKGDIVISSGQGLIFPYGYGIGQATEIVAERERSSIKVEPFININNLHYCTLLAKEEMQ